MAATMASMPQGLVRIQQSRQSHFVTISCYRREARLADEGICRAFLDSLKCVRSTRGLRVDGYVRMPEHVHLLLSEPERGLLCGALQALKISVVRRTGGRRLWQRRYYDRNVSHHAEFVEKLRYIHRNPVKRGLCAQPEEWPWSSFHHYLTAEPGVVEIESEWTAMRRAGREPNPMKLAAVSAPTSAKCRQIWGTLNLETSDVGHQPLIGEINHGKRPVCPRISDCSSTAATAAHSWALSHLPCD